MDMLSGIWNGQQMARGSTVAPSLIVGISGGIAGAISGGIPGIGGAQPIGGRVAGVLTVLMISSPGALRWRT